ncbi:MAG TPA: tetratricopeptide repeat protein [Anaerolineales bacterium]|nr:tetratricopeptide repeat protein [Anaerolineales bacterium]
MDGAPWVTPSKSRSNLPAPTTSLVGREQETLAIREYLHRADIRLLTLSGPPGIGKTRLGLEVAHVSLFDFSDGVFFVPLAPISDPALISLTVAQALGFVEVKLNTPLERLKTDIGGKQLLLVLDNLEHIIEGAALLISDLLSACPRLKILTTSREVLRVPGEWLYPVPTLGIPAQTQLHSLSPEEVSQYTALTLFAERARAARSDFVLDTDNLSTVAAICTKLDGLPLAIELIAARIRVMSPQALLAKLHNQFVLFADGMRAVPARQKTLHNAITWSYNLLSPDEQTLFVRLSVFSGGFTLEAAEAVFSQGTNKPVSDLIALLLDKSLLQRTLDVRGKPRFHMLVTIRQFAMDHLYPGGEEGEVRDWHLAYFLDIAEQADGKIPGLHQQDWLRRLGVDHDNFRSALEWCIYAQKTETALRLLNALCWAWMEREHFGEMYTWLDKVRTLPDLEGYPELYAGLLNYIGLMYWLSGGFDAAQSVLEESHAVWSGLDIDGERGLAEALCILGIIALSSGGDRQKARSFYEQSQKMYRKNGEKWSIAVDIVNLNWFVDEQNPAMAILLLDPGELDSYQKLGHFWEILGQVQVLGYFFLRRRSYEKAYYFLNQQLKIDTSIQFMQGVVVGLGNLGDLQRYQDHYEQATHYYEESLAISREHRQDTESLSLYGLGMVALHHKDYRVANQHFIDYFKTAWQLDEHIRACDFLLASAAIAAGLNHPKRAAKLYGAALALCDLMEYRVVPFDHAEFDWHVHIALNQLGETVFEALTAKGRAMTMEQAIDYALETSTSS